MGQVKDITGQKFYRLTAIKRVANDIHENARWLFKCECGAEKIANSSEVMRGHTKSCGCYRRDVQSVKGRKGSKSIDMTGRRVGKFTVIRLTDKQKGHSYLWESKCDCGAVEFHRTFDLNNSKKVMCKSCENALKTKNKLWTGIRFDVPNDVFVVTLTRYSKIYKLGSYKNGDDALHIRKLAEKMSFDEFIKWYENEFNNSGEK